MSVLIDERRGIAPAAMCVDPVRSLLATDCCTKPARALEKKAALIEAELTSRFYVLATHRKYQLAARGIHRKG